MYCRLSFMANRIWFIDYAKIIGLCMVIFAHLYTSEGTDTNNIIRTFFYGFHMQFFFAVSGMLYKERKEGLRFALLKNVKTLFVPWLIFNLFFILIGIITTDNSPLAVIKTFIICVAKGKGTICGASWFVICLFIIKCVYDILKKNRQNVFGMVYYSPYFYSNQTKIFLFCIINYRIRILLFRQYFI